MKSHLDTNVIPPSRQREAPRAGLTWIGQSITRVEDPRILPGNGGYIDDFKVPGMAHAAMVASPHAHARIVSIDTSRAKALPGVIGVYTGEDLASVVAPCPSFASPPLPQTAIAVGKVRHVGDPIAVVVAESLGQARDAAEALDILRLGRDRHQVAHNSRLNTVVVSPGGRAKKAVSSGFSRLGGASPHSGRTSLSTTGGPNRPKPLNPRLIKLFIGGIAVAIALGVGVKAFQWGQYRFSQLPQSWEDWRGDKSKSSYAEAKPSELTALLRDGSIQLRPVAAAAFWEMVSAAEEDDVNLFALAGYQPEDATGNASNTSLIDYGTGDAIAIGGADESQVWLKSYAQSDAFDWLSANATNYGFELSITEKGLLGSTSPEPWHWRYVGDSQSQSIFANADR